jgi:hypothetical protein
LPLPHFWLLYQQSGYSGNEFIARVDMLFEVAFSNVLDLFSFCNATHIKQRSQAFQFPKKRF